jgi:DNA ligase-1
MNEIGLQLAYDTEKLTKHISHLSSFPEDFIVEPKYDGIRVACFVYDKDDIRFVTRYGNKVYNISYIEDDIKKQADKLKGYMLDGEIYGKDWNETVSTTRTRTSKKENPDLVYYVFDIIPIENFKKKSYDATLDERKKLLDKLLSNTKHVKKVKYYKIKDMDDALDIYKNEIENGLEGIMLKRIDTPYRFRRTPDWLKVKNILSDEFEVVDVFEGSGKYKNMLGGIVIKLPNGDTMKVGSGFTDEERDRYWKNPKSIIGKTIEVAYQEKTKDGKLRNPRFLRIRMD